MARGVIRLGENEYVEWSSVMDAPTTYLLTRREIVSLCGEDSVARADARGHSWPDLRPQGPEEIISGNRAGPHDTELSLEDLRKASARPPETIHAPRIVTLAESYLVADPISRMQAVLMKAWGITDPTSSVSKNPESYAETFRDLAKAALDHAGIEYVELNRGVDGK